MTKAAIAAVALVPALPAAAQERLSVAPKTMQRIAPALAGYTDRVLFGDVWLRPELSPRDRSIVAPSVLIATGKTAQLAGHLACGLDNGVKPVEVAGVVTQLAVYTGWPDAVSALIEVEKAEAPDGQTVTGSSPCPMPITMALAGRWVHAVADRSTSSKGGRPWMI